MAPSGQLAPSANSEPELLDLGRITRPTPSAKRRDGAGETHRAIEEVFRLERPRLVAGLVRLIRDVDLAEELSQDALVIALTEWPRTGVPANPGAWLMTAARRRGIDAIRRDKVLDRKHAELAREPGCATDAVEATDAAMDDDLGDELLGLIFTACHPDLQRGLCGHDGGPT